MFVVKNSSCRRFLWVMILEKTTLYVYLYVRRHKTFHIQTFQLLQAPTFFWFWGEGNRVDVKAWDTYESKGVKTRSVWSRFGG